MLVSEIINAIKKHGCQMSSSGDVFTVTNIPSWKAYKIVTDNMDELATYHYATEIFSTPTLEYKKPDTQKKNGCPVCYYTNDSRCPWLGKKNLTPNNVFKNGCKDWKRNEDIMF